MQITRLALHNYRNYASLTLSPAPGLNVLVGDNAAGKTNVLESAFLAVIGRSHRTRTDAELVKNGEDAASVDVTADTRAGTREVSVRIPRQGRRKLLIDGAAPGRTGELMGVINAVLFSPEDLSLIKGGPAERRRFVDMALSQEKPGYYYLLQRYGAALRQRNALLKREEAPKDEEFLPWEEQLARSGSGLILARAAFLRRLGETAGRLHDVITDGGEELTLSYMPNVPPDDEKALSDTLRQRLAADRTRDVYRGGTGAGPHRDDIAASISGSDARTFGSQGQQRTAALSLKLAELEILALSTGEKPILLLDDVFSELDRARQRLLITACEGAQTFITCTHIDALENAGAVEMKRYNVRAGTVSEG